MKLESDERIVDVEPIEEADEPAAEEPAPPEDDGATPSEA
jgi:hypothetical protein